MSLRRKLTVVALVYVIEGFPMGVFLDVWPVYFRRHGVSLTEIGWIAGLSMAWSLKVLWSPLVDRFGDRRQWIAGCMAVMGASMVALGASDPSQPGAWLWILLAVFCLGSATQDVAIDAYTIGLVDRGEEGATNSVRIAAYRAGLLLAGGALLFLPRFVGWSGAFAVGGIGMGVLAVAALACPAVPVPPESRGEVIAPLRRWLAKGPAVSMILFVLLYRIGDKAMGPMVKPFWVDRGYSNEQIAVVSNSLGIVAFVVGAGIGGWVVSRVGIARSLWVLGVFALVSNLGYALAAAFPETGAAGIYSASLFESTCSGLVSAAFLSYLMRICQKAHAAVQYALLTALYNLGGSLLAMSSGWITERLDFAAYFALTAVLAAPAFAFLPRAQVWAEIREESVASG